MQKWEYKTVLRKVVHETDMLVEDDLWPIVANHGAEGWELASVQNIFVGGEVKAVVYYFKRPLE